MVSLSLCSFCFAFCVLLLVLVDRVVIILGDVKYLNQAAVVLEYASSKSQHSYAMRVLLIRVYNLLGTYTGTLFFSIHLISSILLPLFTAQALRPSSSHSTTP